MGAIGTVSAAVTAPSAEAAGCTHSNLSVSKVKNVNCNLGAYGYKASASATVGTRVGAWVTAGNWSYSNACYAYPTMVKA